MKLNKSYIWSLVALTSLSLAACGEKDDPAPTGGSGEGGEIGIKTNVTLNTRSALIEELKDGHEMNVWIDVTSELGATVLSTQVHATNNAGTWQFDKSVKLDKGQTAEIYAVYPYTEGATSYKAVPVDITKQVDVLYSGSASYASYTSNVVTLNMKHALSMLSVNIKKEDSYSGNGVISKMKVSKSPLVATKGTLNAATGKIEVTETGDLAGDVNAAIGASGIQGALPALWVAPFSSKDQPELMMTLTIDGKDYTVALPEVSMKTGWQYIFHAVLSGNGLVFVPDATEEYALNKADDEIGTLTGHGVISFTFKGGKFVFPAFAGDNVFGNIKAADGSAANYTIGGSLDLSSASSQEVVVETWNSTGFSLSNIEGVEAIDLSAY